MNVVGRLHVISHAAVGTPGHLQVASLALSAGADTIQFREKGPMPFEERLALALGLRKLTREAGAALIINDHLELAAKCHAEGLHIGREDASASRARRELGPAATIGGTANSFDEALHVAASEVDYLGIGPVFGTQSKRNPAPSLGLGELSRIVKAVSKPVIAIGNITATNLSSVLDAGVHGVAVLSAVAYAVDPKEATRSLVRTLESHARSSA